MNKIDVTDWKEYIVGELFDLNNSTAYHQKDVIESHGDDKIAYITRSKFNNGLNMYVEPNNKFKINPKDTISFGAENANFFYQSNAYITGNKMYYIDTHKLKPMTILFIKTIFEKTFSDNYSFSDGMIPERIKNKKIKLPSNSDGNPNWEYMEMYMEIITKKVRNSISILSRKSKKNKPINIEKWKEFHLYDLFKIDSGTKMDKIAMKYENPSINFVGRSGVNNGVTAVVDKVDNYEPYKAGNLTLALGGAYLGSCFVQKEDFYTSQNVIVLIPKEDISFAAKEFICSIIFKEGNTHYKAFIDELNRHIKTDFSIKLPVDTNGNPDYDLMDKYMSNVRSQIKDKYSCLKTI